jgi:short-subunit dehydrogenase
MGEWLQDVFRGRPWWLNAIMVFCAYMTFIYMPWDILWKPVSRDVEVWFGYLFTGWSAKVTAFLHWYVYGALLFGIRRMRPWIRVALSLYIAQIAFGMWVFSAMRYGSWTGFFLGAIAALPFAALTLYVWRSRDAFRDPRSLRDRYGEWALITGASSGIGTEFARSLAREGISLVLAARRERRLETLAAELSGDYGVETRVVAVDLASSDGPDRLLAAIADLEISILVNNAGVGYIGRFDLQEVDRLRELIALNCVVPVVLTGHLIPEMKARGRGAVIITGSISGRQAIPLHAIYSASKAFDHYFGEALWGELQDSGVDVLVLEPGSTQDTGFQSEAGQIPHSGELPANVVAIGLQALGRQPSIITSWFDWVRAELVTRFVPRNLITLIAGKIMSKHTPSELR